MAKHAKDVTLVLHIGLHKTATTYIQNVLGARRYQLLDHGLLYPDTGTSASSHQRTRDGAQSGHILFTRPGKRARSLVGELLAEIPESVSRVLLSSEDFTRPDPEASPAQHLDLFADFGAVEVVLVLRRQDQWIESYYKQLVDQYGSFEVRSFAEFLAEEGPSLLDFHGRFGEWRELVGPERFHVLSYDDLPSGAAICRRLLEIAGLSGEVLDDVTSFGVPRYDSVRSVDTVGLRLLNSHRLGDRDLRNRVARQIYAAAPEGEVELASPAMRASIAQTCEAGNARIEAEWCEGPIPGLRFGADVERSQVQPPDAADMVRYLDEVMSLCRSARRSAADGGADG